jgi:hypothetical protein
MIAMASIFIGMRDLGGEGVMLQRKSQKFLDPGKSLAWTSSGSTAISANGMNEVMEMIR